MTRSEPAPKDRPTTSPKPKSTTGRQAIDAWRGPLLNRWPEGDERSCELPAGVRWTAYCLSTFMDYGTLEHAHPGMARLAQRTGFSARTVRQHLELLVELRWIELVERGTLPREGERRLANEYSGIPQTKECAALVERAKRAATKEDPASDYGSSRIATTALTASHLLSTPSDDLAPCGRCDGTTWIEGVGGVVRCPECQRGAA